MLKVKTYIDKSTIPNAGYGCFADEDIKEGQLIWQFNYMIDRVFHQNDLDILEPIEIDFIKKYSYMDRGNYYFCVDNARFFNHSSELSNTVDEKITTFAKRDIKRGEEILSDYGTFGTTDEDRKFNLEL